MALSIQVLPLHRPVTSAASSRSLYLQIPALPVPLLLSHMLGALWLGALWLGGPVFQLGLPHLPTSAQWGSHWAALSGSPLSPNTRQV